MAGAGDIQAGRAYVELFTKDGSLYTGLNKAQTRFRNFGVAITAIGSKIAAISAAAIAPFAFAGKMFVDTGDKLDDLSQKTSINVESLSALRYVAELTGNSLEDMTKGLVKGQKLVEAASTGNKAAAATLKDLGLNAKDLIKLAPDKLFAKLVDAVSKIENPNKRAAAAMEVFGKGAATMGELIKKGGPEIERLAKEAENLGLIMSSEDAAAAAEFNDALYGLRQQIGFLIGVGFAPWLRDVTGWLTQSAGRAAKFMKVNQDLTRTIVKMIAVVGAVGIGLIATGAIFSSIAAILGGLMGTLTTIGATFGIISAAVGFLISPLGLVIAAVSSLTAWFVTCTQTGKAMITTLMGYWDDFSAEVKSAFGAIIEALRAGDIQAAWKVVTSFLSLEWAKFTTFLQNSWSLAKGKFLEIWYQAMSAFSHAWNDGAKNGAVAINQMFKNTQIAWTETISAMQKGWSGFVKFVRTHWNTASTWIGQVLALALEKAGAVPEGTAETVGAMGKDIQKEIDQSSAQAAADAEVDRARNRLKIEEDANGREEDIRRQHKDKMIKLDEDQQKQLGEIKKATDAEVAAQQTNLDKALAAFNAAKSNAVAMGQAAQAELLSPNTSPALSTNLNERQKRQAAMLDDESLSEGKRARIERNLKKQGIDVNAYRAGRNGTDGVSDAMDKISARGTFNSAALQSLVNGGSVAQRQLDESKKQTKTLEEIKENTAVEDQELVYT